MCGITGFQTSTDAAINEDALMLMQKHLYHRGPDANGHYLSMHTGIAMTRLAIVDLDHGNQPLFSTKGTVLVANGEIYNSPELRAQFADYPFKTQSDCETILALYERYGANFAEHLRGMYAAAIYDPASCRLILTRDPYGIKPLYFVEHEGLFAFSSELPPLIEAGFAARKLNPMAESELLQLKFVTSSKTIFPEIKRVGPGETIIVKDTKVVRVRRLSPWEGRVPAKGPDKAGHKASSALLDEFSDVISDSVSVHLRSDAPWCLFYSGGIDSTILMRVAMKVSAQRFQAITIGYPGEEADDESANALKLATASGVQCERIEMSFDDFWNLAPRIAAAMDDPIADPAVLPLYLLSKAAAERGYKVAITGEGADEVFGGYSRYRRATLPNFLRPKKARRGVFTNSAVAQGRFANWYGDINALEAEQTEQWKSRLQVVQAVDVLERLPNCLLIKLDRALMANGVEGRTPFLDKEVVGFAAKIPDRLKANARFGKRLLRDWLAREFPQAKPYAPKQGFEVPLASWMFPRRAQLAALVRAQPEIARIFDPAEVDAIFEDCKNDKQRPWSLLFYALWHSHHILGVDSRGDIAAVLSEAAPHLSAPAAPSFPAEPNDFVVLAR